MTSAWSQILHSLLDSPFPPLANISGYMEALGVWVQTFPLLGLDHWEGLAVGKSEGLQ